MIFTPDEKEEALSEVGIDYLLMPQFDAEVAETPRETFARFLFQELRAKVVCVGFNYRLGKGALGTPLYLKQWAEQYGAELLEQPPFLAEGKAVSEEVPLLAPPAVELNPQVVKVTWKIDVKRRTLSLQRDIIFEGENPNVSAQPSRANLMVSVPQAMVKDAGYLAQFQVSVPSDTAMPAEDGAVNAPLQVAVPQGGRVLKISPETVSISRHPSE